MISILQKNKPIVVIAVNIGRLKIWLKLNWTGAHCNRTFQTFLSMMGISCWNYFTPCMRHPKPLLVNIIGRWNMTHIETVWSSSNFNE